MKNKLECQVTSCAHYCDNYCCLPGIQVDGPAAQECCQTCCDSYEERGKNGGQNAVSGGNTPSADSSIDCSAENCMHNENCKCKAECVCVGCSCSEPSSKSGTECCTFRAK